MPAEPDQTNMPGTPLAGVDLGTLADLVPVPLWVSDGFAGTSRMNRTMAEFTGRTNEQDVGTGWLEPIHPDDRQTYAEFARAKWADPEPYEITYRLRRVDGAWRHVTNRAVPFAHADGSVGYVGACIDLTEQVDALAQAGRERHQLDFLVGVLAGLVKATTDELRAELDRVTEAIGTFLDLDRVGFVRVDHDARTMELEHWWRSGRLPADHEVVRSLPLDAQPVLWQRLQRQEVAYIDDVASMGPDEAIDQLMLRERGIRANAEVPIVLGGVVTGLLFLDDHHGARCWADVVPTLTVLGHALAGALDRLVADTNQRLAAERFRALFDANPLPVFVVDPATGAIRWYNDAAVDTYGRGALDRRSIVDLHPPSERGEVRALLASSPAAVRHTGAWRHQVPSGRSIDVEMSTRTVALDGREQLLVVVHDVTEERELGRELRHRAFHDVLTGLPNRALLGERLTQALSRRTLDPAALIVIDLDGFKTVNDSLGHVAGDRLLVDVAARLRTVVRQSDALARLGGDEFAIVIEGPNALVAGQHLSERVLAVLAQPYTVDGHQVVLSASLGLAVAGDAATADTLLRDGDLAMFAAKDAGRGRMVEFTRDLEQRALDRLQLLGDVQDALARGEFVLHYQPTVALADGAVRGVEALIRWQHPVHGLLPPVRFLPAIEDTPLIATVGEWVLAEACRQHQRWTAELGWSPTVAVNVAPRQLHQTGFVAHVAATLAAHGVPPDQLVVEITERSLLDDEATHRRLQGLHDLGVQVAIDDFGTGYSSLSYLRRLPVDILKIDRSFVAALDDETDAAAAVVATISELANVLDLRTIAEGIETEAQRAALRRVGCEVGQGYLFARPEPVAETTARLRGQHVAAAEPA